MQYDGLLAIDLCGCSLTVSFELDFLAVCIDPKNIVHFF